MTYDNMEVQSSDSKVLENSMESSTESGLSVESMFERLKERLFASFTVEEFLIKPEELMILNEKEGKTSSSVENSIKVGHQDRSECNNNTLSESCRWQGQMDAVEFSFEVDQSQTNSKKDVSPSTSMIGSPAAQSTQIDSSQNMSRNTQHSLRNRKGMSNVNTSENDFDNSGTVDEVDSSNSDVQLMKEYYSPDTSLETSESKLQNLQCYITRKRRTIKALEEKLDKMLHKKETITVVSATVNNRNGEKEENVVSDGSEKERDSEIGKIMDIDKEKEKSVETLKENERENMLVEPANDDENSDDPMPENNKSNDESSMDVSKLVARIEEHMDDCNNKLTKSTCDSDNRGKDKENNAVISVEENLTLETSPPSNSTNKVNKSSTQGQKDKRKDVSPEVANDFKSCKTSLNVSVKDLCDKNLKPKRQSIRQTVAESDDVRQRNKTEKQNETKEVNNGRKEVNNERKDINNGTKDVNYEIQDVINERKDLNNEIEDVKKKVKSVNNEKNERKDANENGKDRKNLNNGNKRKKSVNNQTNIRKDMNKKEKRRSDRIKSKNESECVYKLPESEKCMEQNDELCENEQSYSQSVDEADTSDSNNKAKSEKSKTLDNSGSSARLLYSPLNSPRNMSDYLGVEIETLQKGSGKNPIENNKDVVMAGNVSSEELNSTNSSLDIVPPSPVIATQAFHVALEQETQPFVPDLSGLTMDVSDSSYYGIVNTSKEKEVHNEETNGKSDANVDNKENSLVKEKKLHNATTNDKSDLNIVKTSKDTRTLVEKTCDKLKLDNVNTIGVDKSPCEKNDKSKVDNENDDDDDETQSPYTKLIDKPIVVESIDLEENSDLKAAANDSLTSSDSVVFTEPSFKHTGASRKRTLALKSKTVNQTNVNSPNEVIDSGATKSLSVPVSGGAFCIKPGGIKRKVSLSTSSIDSTNVKRKKYSKANEISKEGSNKVNDSQNEKNSAILIDSEMNDSLDNVRRRINLDDSESEELNDVSKGARAKYSVKGPKEGASTIITKTIKQNEKGQLMYGEVNGEYRFYRSPIQNNVSKNGQNENRTECIKNKLDCAFKDFKTKLDKVPYIKEWLSKHEGIDKPKLPEGSQEWASHENQQDKTTMRFKDKKSTCRKNITDWIQPDFTSGENSSVHEAKDNDNSTPSKSADERKLKDVEIRLERVDNVYTFHSTASLNDKSNEKKSVKNHRTFTFTRTNKDNEKDTVGTDRTEQRNKDNENINQRTKEAWESMPSAALYLRNFEKT